MQVALFPISVDSRIFTTENVRSSLQYLNEYSDILFFVAHGLQLYNRAIWATSDAEIWSAKFRAREGAEYTEQRRAWLKRLKREAVSSSICQNWKVIGTEDITFPELVIALRNVGILFETDNEFRQDVLAVALDYVCSRKNVMDTENGKNLSVRYILEELACNVVLTLRCKAYDEYYLGVLPAPLLALYAGRYAANVFQICGQAPNAASFKFFTWNVQDTQADSKGSWQLVSDTVVPDECGGAEPR